MILEKEGGKILKLSCLFLKVVPFVYEIAHSSKTREQTEKKKEREERRQSSREIGRGKQKRV